MTGSTTTSDPVPVRSPRAKVVGRIADHLVEHDTGHPLRVAVDGVTGAGKSTFARELTDAIARSGRPTVHLTMDGFHHPRAHRYRQGRDSAVGYFQDAYDFATLARDTLAPLGPGGDLRYRRRSLDLAADALVTDDWADAEPEAVLIVDGTFLQNDDLGALWDERVFVDTAFEVARERAACRDADHFGGLDAVRAVLDSRYHAACRLYVERTDPARRATVVVDNNDLEHPVLQQIGGNSQATVDLFSYGTLQQSDVQLANFGRTLQGRSDTLPGHTRGWVMITDPAVVAASGSDRHPLVRPTGDPDEVVTGTVFTLDTAELAAADRYEVDDYRRTQVRLESGRRAWVYLADEV